MRRFSVTELELAVHESSHAVVGHLEGYRLVAIELGARGQADSGQTRFSESTDPLGIGAGQAATGLRLAAVYAAGYLGEKRLRGTPYRVRGQDDAGGDAWVIAQIANAIPCDPEGLRVAAELRASSLLDAYWCAVWELALALVDRGSFDPDSIDQANEVVEEQIRVVINAHKPAAS